MKIHPRRKKTEKYKKLKIRTPPSPPIVELSLNIKEIKENKTKTKKSCFNLRKT